MSTLKDHQQAMVDLLASGSGIPASASRLAHAMHDVLGIMLCNSSVLADEMSANILSRIKDATTPGLNDKALAGDIEACRPKATPAERRVKELENTVKQLREQVAKQRKDIAFLKMERNNAVAQLPEQAGCRKDDTQVCEHEWAVTDPDNFQTCCKCGAVS